MTQHFDGAATPAADDLLAPPSYPDIHDVSTDAFDGSDGIATIPAPVPVEQAPLAPLAAPVPTAGGASQGALAVPAAPTPAAAPQTAAGEPTSPQQSPVPTPAPASPRIDSLRSSIDMARQIGNEGLAQDYERQLREAQAATPAPSAADQRFTRFGPFAVPRAQAPEPQAPAAPQDPDRITVEGLSIRYAGDPAVPYSRGATAAARPFRGIVFHHSGIGDAATAVAYQNRGDAARGGHFGYHFYIDPDGTITQGAPLSRRTNHVKAVGSAQRRDAFDISNEDTIGIAISGSTDNPTPAQQEAARKLTAALQQRYSIPTTAAVGHGELQSDRQSGEGSTLARLIRGEAAPAFGPRQDAIRAPQHVVEVTARASRETGVSQSYLVSLARAESSFRPDARTNVPGQTAAGLFGFTVGTWRSMLEKHGAALGIPANTPPTDPQAAALLAAALTKENRAALEAAFPGRTITDADLRVAHFAGAAGSVRFLQGLAANPEQPATAIASADAVAANRAVFFHRDGRQRTAREVHAHLTAGFTGGSVEVDPSARRDPTSPLRPHDVAAAPPVMLGQRYEQGLLASVRARQGEQAAPFFGLLGDALRTETLLGRLASAPGTPTPDPHFSIGPILKDLTAGLPDRFHDRFAYAVSEQHALDIRALALRDAKAEEDRERAGWTGTAAQVLTGFFGPVELAAGIASGGLAAGAANMMRLGRAGGMALQAGAGAGANIGVEAALAGTVGDTPSSSQLLFAGLTGAAFGAAFGPIARNPATEDMAALLLRSTQSARAELLAGTSEEAITLSGRGASAGAAFNDAMSAPPILNDAVFRAVQDGDVPRGTGTWLDRLRFSSGGQIANSPNPITRLFGGVMALDNVGKGVHVNGRTADQRTEMLNARWEASWLRAAVPAYREWAEANGYNAAQRKLGAGLEEFGNQVGLAVRQTDRALFDALPDPVKRAATEYRQQMQERRLDQQDPRRHSGGGGRPLPGAEALDDDPGYITRIWVDHRIQAAVRKFGWANVEDVVAGAIKRAQGPIDDDLARKLASTILRSPASRDVNLDNTLSRALSSNDATLLREALEQTHHWDPKDVEALVKQLARGQETARDAHLKRRVDLDENHFVDDLRTTDGGRDILRVSDLLESNAFVILTNYNRKVAGRVALAEQRIVNPSNGEVIMDGITSDADLETIVRRMKQWGIGNGQDAASITRDEANLRWVHDRILGRPDPAIERLGDAARWMSALKAFNHSRLMGMLGLAQVADVGRAAAGTGVRAFVQHMSAFRRIVEMDGKAILQHGLDREVEAMFGSGADALRGFVRQVREDEALANAGRTGTLETVERTTRALASVTNSVSGFNAINSWGQLTTGKAAAQRFADMAAKGELTAAERRLLNFLGLDDTRPLTRTIGGREVTDTELGHVLRSVRDHFSLEDGSLMGRKVTALNLDAWADQEARAHFEQAVYRFSRHAWQENDIGALHRVMSHPVAQLLLQFRRFSIVAWENQLLHGVANWDGRQAAMFAGTLLSGSLVYAVQTHLQAIGRSDAREFLQSKGFGLRDNEDYMKLGFAALQRAGFSSLVPMALDTVLLGTPVGPQFGARSSGQPSDVLFGNASFGLAADAARASKGVIGAFYRGEDMSQTDLRAVFRLLSLQNAMPITQGFSLMISGREAPNLGGGR